MATVRRLVNLEQATRALALCIATDIPLCFWGRKGIGKSSIVKQAVEKLNARIEREVAAAIAAGTRTAPLDPETDLWWLYDFRLGDKDPTDLGGIPFPDGEDKLLYRVLRTLPFDNTRKAIIFLDEVDRTEMQTMNVAQQYVLDREVNGHKFSPNARLLLAGNGTTDIGTTPLSEAFANRICHLYLETASEAAHEAWEAWAVEAGVSPMMIAFAKFDREAWLGGDGVVEYEDLAEPSNRSWVMADDLIKAASQVNFQTSDILAPLVNGCIGDAAGTKLLAFEDLFTHAPTVEQVVADPANCALPTRPDILYAMGNALATHIKAHTADREAVAQYGLRWPEEPAARYFRKLLSEQPEVATTQAFNKWNNGHLGATARAKIEVSVAPPTPSVAPIPQVVASTFPTHGNNSTATLAPPVAAPVAAPALGPLAPGLNRAFQKQALAAYRGTALPDNDLWINRVEIIAPSGSKYTVSQQRSDLMEGCSCPAWKNHLSRPCKHLLEIHKHKGAV